MSANPVELAYKAHTYIPVEKYRKGKDKKAHSPAVAAPALAQAMQHLGPEGLPLAKAVVEARKAIQEPQALAYLEQLDWEELKTFLNTVALFVKAGGQVKRGQTAMRAFVAAQERRYSAEERAQTALALASTLKKHKEPANRNKLQRLSAQVAAAHNKWDVLVCLAQYYPLRGIPEPAIDEMVGLLEQADLYSFKEIVAQSLVFFEASAKGWEGLQS